MPLYDYKCKDHGVFHQLATMEQSALPQACPKCRSLSPRIIMIPPEVLAMAPAKRQAIERNEKAKFEPRISTADSRAELAERNKSACCAGSHQRHQGHGDKQPKVDSLRKQVLYMADGSKIFPSQRPWMISH